MSEEANQPRRTARGWAMLLGVWGVGLCVWGMYLALVVLLMLRAMS